MWGVNNFMSKNLQDLVSALANSAYRNRLVLFLGAGFSKAVMGYDPMDIDDHYSYEKAKDVLSWLELLDKCREKLGLVPKQYPHNFTRNHNNKHICNQFCTLLRN